jgi:hypothetical protein
MGPWSNYRAPCTRLISVTCFEFDTQIADAAIRNNKILYCFGRDGSDQYMQTSVTQAETVVIGSTNFSCTPYRYATSRSINFGPA